MVKKMKTNYSSYRLKSFPKGCKLCVKGRKSVVFVTGLCSRGCKFCPLSNIRKNKDTAYINERKILSKKDIIQEIKISGAKGCSLTGGDPLLNLERTLNYAKIIKQNFGKRFHIHIYLSTKLVDEFKLKNLSEYIDEVRFHPDLDGKIQEEIRKISLAKKFWKKKNIGIELPMFPDKQKEILTFIKCVRPFISFVNLNELESGESSERYILKKYSLNEEGYTVENSLKVGLDLLKKIKKERLGLRVHLCTAHLKNWYQYRNRLKNYKIPKFFKKTPEGTLIYFVTKENPNLNATDFYKDKSKPQWILNPRKVRSLISNLKVYRIEEYPTYEREEAEVEELK